MERKRARRKVETGLMGTDCGTEVGTVSESGGADMSMELKTENVELAEGGMGMMMEGEGLTLGSGLWQMPLLPNDHVRALVELLQPGGPDLARRWVSALLLVPIDQRESLVREVERRIVETWPSARPAVMPPGERRPMDEDDE